MISIYKCHFIAKLATPWEENFRVRRLSEPAKEEIGGKKQAPPIMVGTGGVVFARIKENGDAINSRDNKKLYGII
jgi:hypothetical protein